MITPSHSLQSYPFLLFESANINLDINLNISSFFSVEIDIYEMHTYLLNFFKYTHANKWVLCMLFKWLLFCLYKIDTNL